MVLNPSFCADVFAFTAGVGLAGAADAVRAAIRALGERAELAAALAGAGAGALGAGEDLALTAFPCVGFATGMVSLEAGGETDAVALGSLAPPAVGATVGDEATSECSISVWVALSRKGVLILVSPVTPAVTAVEVSCPAPCEASRRAASTRAFSTAPAGAEVVTTGPALFAIGSAIGWAAADSIRRSVGALRFAELALVGALAAGFAAALLAGAAFRAAADFDAPERAALALAAVLAAARVLVAVLAAVLAAAVLAAAVLAEAVLAMVLAELLVEELAPAALLALVRTEDLAAALPAAPRVEAVRPPPDFEARPAVAVFAVAVAVFVAVFDGLAAAFALAAFFVRVSAEAVLSPAPFVAPRRVAAADALRFLAVFLLDEGIRGYSFYCPAVETGREAS
ncbi:hypothetical protein [Methylosinus sp. Ce-a6]|uniref:hypothetical protein n=1 Tax=Methylosinus sp. Ce-a6 TaxID=2172005 RepID=UPI001356789B|nr:hypothetical protein [Methylosinus sp. Ce-a6]